MAIQQGRMVFKQKSKKIILNLIFNFQKLILYLSFFFYGLKKKIFYKKKKQISWVLGVVENAAVLKYLSLSIPNCYSVCLKKDPFYKDFNYDYFLTHNNSYLFYLKILFLGPILLGKLIHESQGFFYIWSTRFLINHIDYPVGKFEKKRDK